MDFDQILDRAIEMLQRRGRLTYRTLKRQFNLDEETLEDLKFELIEGQQIATDERATVLVWTGEPSSTPSAAAPAYPSASVREPLTYTPPYLTEKILTSRSALEGERKQVTVLFADIKNSTELIRDLDPEDAQQLLDPAIHIMMDAVHRFEGAVNQVLGDGVMSIFGAPIAHEDHAARACYAALAMQSAMQNYTEKVRRSRGLTLRIRVGLNSGEVVVRTIGNDLHMDYSAVGQTTHLASRMEQLADPGHIILTAATLRLVEGLVRVHALGPIPVKGMDKPVEVYELTDANSVRRRLQAAVARGLTKFVGRDTEIDVLNQALAKTISGYGQIVAVVGEAGVGKSRLFYEFVHSYRRQGRLVLESASVFYGKATPYLPVIDLLKQYTHVEDGDDARTIRAKVTGQILTLDESLQDTIPAILSLLNALPEDSPFVQLDPSQRRQRTLDGLKRILLRESQVQPLILVFEDLRWHDNESQALLDSLFEDVPTAKLLLLVNYRPEYQHAWGSKIYYIQLRLDPLSVKNSDVLLETLLGNNASLEPLKKYLIERSAGNPFFLEESVRTLLETQGLDGEPGQYRLSQDLPAIQVPSTVQAVLAARMDRLPQDAKRLLQTASVIGNEAPFALMQAISEMPPETLHLCLTQLQAAEFLYETNMFPESIYTFKHALTHEVAYSGLLQERRRALHGRILQALETLEDNRRTEQVERLAHHALRGEAWEKALNYCRQAGIKAMARSACLEAVVCYEQALAARGHLPERRDRHEQAIDLRLDLRNARLVLGDLEGVINDLREAERLAKALDDSTRLARVWLYMVMHFVVTGAYDQAAAFAQRALDLATNSKDTGFQVMAYNYLGTISHCKGEYARSRDYGQQARALLAGNLLYESFGEVSFPAVHTRYWLSICLAELGEFTEGATMSAEGFHIAEAVQHPFSLMLALYGAGTVHLRQGELDQAAPLLERGAHICQEADLMLHFSPIATALGSAYILAGRVADALPLLEKAVSQAVSIGRMDRQALNIATLSEAHLHAGHLDVACALAEQALERSHTYKERGSEASIWRLLGDIAMHAAPADVAQAEIHYQQALTLADELGMRPLQAHCHRGLGALYSQTGQAEQARAELSTAIDMYRDMETFWLPETEAALAKVEGKA